MNILYIIHDSSHSISGLTGKHRYSPCPIELHRPSAKEKFILRDKKKYLFKFIIQTLMPIKFIFNGFLFDKNIIRMNGSPNGRNASYIWRRLVF